MNQRLGRLLLGGLCCLVAASAAQAQHDRFGRSPDWRPVRGQPHPWADNRALPSHRPIDSGVGDLSQAEVLLAQRLHHTHNLQDLQDLLKPFQDNPELLKQFKNVKPEDLRNLEDAVKNNPSLLDDPKLGDLLTQVGKLKRGEKLDDDKRKELESLAKGLFDEHNQELPSLFHPGASGPITSPNSAHPPEPSNPPPLLSGSVPPPAPTSSGPSWVNHDLLAGVANVLKDIDHSPEGEALRDAAMRDLAKSNAGPPSGLVDFFKGVANSDEAAWLAHDFKPPSMPNVGGWSTNSVATAAPSLGDSDGMLDSMIWIAVLVLIGAGAWTAYAAARRQTAAARSKDWAPGPWPVLPSQVSTRQDLIRAFEHLAYLCLGRAARTLNHLDVASRLGRSGEDRAAAAGRLAHLYEQARYAPPNEPLPADELTAARGDLTALAGAAA